MLAAGCPAAMPSSGGLPRLSPAHADRPGPCQAARRGQNPQSGQQGPSIFPVTSFAVRVKAKPTDNTYVMAAALDGVAGLPGSPHGTQIAWSQTECTPWPNKWSTGKRMIRGRDWRSSPGS